MTKWIFYWYNWLDLGGNDNMKKVIPVLIALILIGVIVYVSFGKQVIDHFSYGHDTADLNDYFDIHNDKEIPIILENVKTGTAARYIDGVPYLSRELVEEYLTSRFYYDNNEGLVLYTTSTDIIKTEMGSNVFVKNGEEHTMKFPLTVVENEVLYFALDYLKEFVSFSYTLYYEPNRMQLFNVGNAGEIATIKEDTQVRSLAGIKAPILKEVKEGEIVEILDELDEWQKVKTIDCFIGYVEKKKLTDYEDRAKIELPTVEAEEEVSLTRNHKINLTWHDMEYPQDGADLRKILANTKELNVVSPTWFWLTDNNGTYKSVANANYVKTAHEMGLEVWALIANFHYGTDVDLTEVLSYTSKRTELINNLVNEVVSYGADGINVDFESVPKACADHYVQFIRELGLKCHENNLVLSVDNYVPTEYTAHYNRKEQALFADYIIIMGYDEHYVGSDAGSVSSIDWMTTGIENTLKYVPAEKVINAIPFYTRVWKTKDGNTTSEAVVMEVAQNFLARNNLTATLDPATGQNYAEATFDGTYYQVWMEDAYSVGVRLGVINAHNLAGVASWKVSQETPDIWDIIANYMLY